MTEEDPKPEPLVGANGQTFIPGTGKFANYYKPESGGPWYELRDGAMVKADFRRGPKWWRRLHWFWKVLIVIAAFSWGMWLLAFGFSFIVGSTADDAPEPVPTPTTSDQLTEEQWIEQAADAIEETWTLENKAGACATLASSTSIYEYAQNFAEVGYSDDDALLWARAVALFCSR